MSRRLAHDVRRPLTRPDSPLALRARRAAQPKSRDITGTFCPGRLANTIPQPLLIRFHSFHANLSRKRIALNAQIAEIGHGGTFWDVRRSEYPLAVSFADPPPLETTGSWSLLDQF